MNKLFLFDIDGTLIYLMKFHVASYKRAYRQVLNLKVKKDELTKWFGLPEPDVHRNLIREKGIRVTGDLKETVKKLGDTYRKNFFGSLEDDLSRYVLPGVIEFLEYLKSNSIPAGIVTGNFKENAEMLLKRAGLSGYFITGGYGDKARSRKGIVLEALENFRKLGYEFEKRNIYVVGDSPFDIQGANEACVVSVGVTTGFNDEKKLREAGAKEVFKNMRECKRLLS